MDGPELGPDIERMTAYCTYCPKLCRFSCPAAAGEGRETVTPWGMMRLLELARDGSVSLDAEVADVFFHCTGCRRCKAFCRHENDVPRALWKARTWAVEQGLLPPALESLRDSFEAYGSPYDEMPAVDDSAFDPESPFAFWPDCSTVAQRPEDIPRTGRLLEALLGRRARLVTDPDVGVPCCGFPLTSAGLSNGRTIRDERWPAFKGVEAIYTDCPSLSAWTSESGSWESPTRPSDPSVAHLLQLFHHSRALPQPARRLQLGHAVLHPDCQLARQFQGLDELDRILAHICEEPPQAAPFSDEESPCCGGEHTYARLEPTGAAGAARALLDATDTPSSTPVITTSRTCAGHLEKADPRRQVLTLLDLLFDAYAC
jgi:Fe-S oxidoreductase